MSGPADVKAPVLLKRGRVIDPRSGVDGVRDVLLRDGKVAQVSEAPLSVPGAREVDCAGRWVVPGLVDLHVHLREPGEEGKETVLTGCRAAVAGGFTAVVAMPNTKLVNDAPIVTELVLARARAADLCRVYPAGAITKGLKGEELAEMGELLAAGCVAVTDDGRPVMNAALMRRALQYSTMFDVPVMVHEEDLTLSARGAMTEGARGTRMGLLPYPASAEVAMVARDVVLLEEVPRARLHLAHISCEGSVRHLREAKRRGLRITAEATPHHFTLDDAAVGAYDTNAKMNPPLRLDRDVEAIREALADGTIDCIATDHAPHGVLDKQVEFEKGINGIIGLETALGLSLALVHQGLIGPRRLVELLSDGPARAFGLPGGHLAVGAPADVTVIDPDAEWVVDAARSYSKSRNTPFHGRRLKGRATSTWVGGREVFDGTRVLESSPPPHPGAAGKESTR